MKKIKNLLFILMLMLFSVFGLSSANALTINKIYKHTETVLAGSAFFSSVGSIDGNANFDSAVDYFYSTGFGNHETGTVEIVPLEVNVAQDSINFSIKIPESFFVHHNSVDEALSKIKFSKLDLVNGEYRFEPVFDITHEYDYDTTGYTFKIRKGYYDSNSNIDGPVPFVEDDNGDYYVMVETNFKDRLGNFPSIGSKVYYALTICYTEDEPEPVTPTTTTTTTTTTVVTTTVENPKTLDGNSQLYIVIGVIGLVGILGLGAKFAKSSK